MVEPTAHVGNDVAGIETGIHESRALPWVPRDVRAFLVKISHTRA